MKGFTDLIDRLGGKMFRWLETGIVMLPNLVIALIIVVVGVFAAKWVQKAVRGILHRTTRNEPISELLGAVSRVAVIVIAAFVALGLLQLDKTVTSLLAGVGVIGLALGFAFQDIAANFMAGFMMALRRPFDVGDQVEVGGHMGRILQIQLRATELETLNGLNVLIPNKDVFQNPIVNYTQTPRRRLDLAVGTAYGDDMEKVRAVIIDAVANIPFRDSGRDTEVFFNAFGDSSINSSVRIWLTESGQRNFLCAQSEAMIAIKKAFDRESITIPFPIRTLDFGAGVVGGVRLDAMTLNVAGERPAAAE